MNASRPIMPTTFRPPGASSIARPWESRAPRWRPSRREVEAEREVSADGLAASSRRRRKRRRRRSAPSPNFRRCGAPCRGRAEIRSTRSCVRNASRCAISWCGSASTPRCNLRRRWCADSPAGSQPLLNWKLRAVQLASPRFRSQCSAQRYRSASGAARNSEISGPAPGSGVRWAALTRRRARAIPIWWFPPAERARYEPPSRASLRFSRTPSTSASAAAFSRTIRRTRDAC